VKYTHPRNPDKVYYISNGWSGYTQIKEYFKGSPRTKLDVDAIQLKSFKNKLEENGWIAVDNS